MTLRFAAFDHVYGVACALLPSGMNSARAQAMLIAIAMQESRFEHRRQVGGPARGFWQFEFAGVRGVQRHSTTREHISSVLRVLCYELEPQMSYVAIEHNDILACVYARLLLWTLPAPLPAQDEPDIAWGQYLDAWRPGRPRRETWSANYARAWKAVNEGEEL